MRVLIWESNQVRETADLGDIRRLVQEGWGAHYTLWVDLSPPERGELLELQQIFSFHDLAVADCLDDTNNKPRIVDHQNHCFIILQGILGLNDGDIEVAELDVFLGAKFIVTVHQSRIDIVDHVWNKAVGSNDIMPKGPDFVLYSLVDGMTDAYFTVIESLDDQVDNLEDAIFTHPTDDILNEIFKLKHQLVHLRRVAGPQREVFAMLNHREFPYIDQETLIYFRDVYEHLIRIYESIDSLRDLISATLETYVSVVSNRLNQIMKTLTVVATIFMPLTFLSSIYGMNFEFMPVLHWRWGYYGCLSFMALLGTWMVLVFRRKKWI